MVNVCSVSFVILFYFSVKHFGFKSVIEMKCIFFWLHNKPLYNDVVYQLCVSLL